MKIYTKTGDAGHTKLGTGDTVAKGDPRLDAYGTIDELSSFIGLAVSGLNDDELRDSLTWLQRKLFVIGSILAFPGRTESKGIGQITPEDVRRLENGVDAMEEQLPPLANFILPGGTREAAQLHCARSICRRAERFASGLDFAEYPLGESILPFLNRLSDYLFCLARLVNHKAGGEESLAKEVKE